MKSNLNSYFIYYIFTSAFYFLFATDPTFIINGVAAQSSTNTTTIRTSDLKCNGYSEFCSKSFDRILFPMTHNSYSAQKDDLGKAPPLAANQVNDWTIDKQLNDGIRAFELDLWRKQGESDIHVCHGGCSSLFLDGGKLKDILKLFADFLSANPTEVITIFVENGSGAKLTAQEQSNEFSSIQQWLFAPTPAGNSTWPTMRELIARNKRVVLFTDYNVDTATYPTLLPMGNTITSNDYRAFNESSFDCERLSSTAPLGAPGTLMRINHFLSTRLFNSDDFYLPTYESRNTVNTQSSLQAHLQKCTDKKIFVNYLTLDWASVGDLMSVVAKYNGVTALSNINKNSISDGGNSLSDASSFSFLFKKSSLIPVGILMMVHSMFC